MPDTRLTVEELLNTKTLYCFYNFSFLSYDKTQSIVYAAAVLPVLSVCQFIVSVKTAK